MTVNFVGNLCRDVSIKTGDDGKKIAHVDVAVNVYGRDEPMYIHIIASGAKGKYLSKLSKGCRVSVSGVNYTHDLYTNKDGKTYINASCFLAEISSFSNNNKEDDNNNKEGDW